MVKKERKSKNLINRKAGFDYQFLESLEAGLVLTGEEIKAIRVKRVNLSGSQIKIIGGEAFWVGGIINVASGDQQRTRKILLHRKEIERIAGKSEEKGLTIIPKRIYLKHGKAKLEIALSRGKKIYDKRQIIKKRDLDLEAARSVKY